jgi:excisionase family DNA binding protein
MAVVDWEALPPALTTDQAAELLHLSRDALERAAKRGDAPVPHYRWGRSLRWPREPIRQLLGLGPPSGNGAPARIRAS